MKKKLLALVLALCLISALAVTASADGRVEANEGEVITYTATYNGEITQGGFYLLLAIKGEEPAPGETPTIAPGTLSADGIMYIDQVTATATDAAAGKITLDGFIPKSYAGGRVFISGTGLEAPIYIGYMTSFGITISAAVTTTKSTDNGQSINATGAIVTITTKDGSVSGEVSNDGSLVISGVTSTEDTATIEISKPGCVTIIINDVPIGADLQIPEISLPVGDLNGDRYINSSDVNIVWNSYTAHADGSIADLNGDGKVNSSDVNIVWDGDNFGATPGGNTFTYTDIID